MSDFEQAPNDVTTTPLGEVPILEKHAHPIAFSLLAITILLAGVFYFVNFQSGLAPEELVVPVAEEKSTVACNYANELEAYNDAILTTDPQKCECVTDGEKKNMCLAVTQDDALIKQARETFDVTNCEGIQTPDKKESCIQLVESGVTYLSNEDPAYLINTYLNSQNYAGAVEVYESLTSDESLDANIMARLAYAVGATSAIDEGTFDEQKLEKAFTLLEAAKKRDPEYNEVYSIEGTMYRDFKNDYQKAITAYTKSIELVSDNLYTYISRGRAYRLAGELENAVADFEKALSLDESKSVTEINYSLCLLYGTGPTANKEKATSHCTIALVKETNPVMIEELQKSMAGTE